MSIALVSDNFPRIAFRSNPDRWLTFVFLITILIGVPGKACAQAPEVEKPVKLSAEASKKLNQSLYDSVVESAQEMGDALKDAGAGKTSGTWTIKVAAGKPMGDIFESASDTSISARFSLNPKGKAKVSGIIFPARLTLRLRESTEVDGVKLDKGIELERTGKGSGIWWVRSKELAEKEITRRKGARKAKDTK